MPETLPELLAAIDQIPAWISMHWLQITTAVAAGLIVYTLLRTVRGMVRRAAVRQADARGFAATTLRVLARTRQFFLVMASVRLVVGYANPPEWLDNATRFLFLVAAAMQAAIWVRQIILSIVRQRAASGMSETLGTALTLINILVSIALFAIAGIVILDNVGVNVTGLVAGLGVGGIAVGLAAKGVFEDLFAALAIIFDRPFRLGDTVKFNGHTATVERIGLKSTRLRAITGEEVIVANTFLLASEVSNLAHVPRRRIQISVGVTYETPLEKLSSVRGLLVEIVEAEGGVIVNCGIVQFADSAIAFELHYDDPAGTYAEVFAHRHAILLTIIERFAAEGIGFAYPTQVTYTAAPGGEIVSPWPPAADPHQH